jgi:hypothetical protein
MAKTLSNREKTALLRLASHTDSYSDILRRLRSQPAMFLAAVINEWNEGEDCVPEMLRTEVLCELCKAAKPKRKRPAKAPKKTPTIVDLDF